MKKLFASLFVVAFCLMATVTVVNASSVTPRWYIGEQFNTKGKTVTKEVSRTGNFYNGLELLEKYGDSATMTIQLKGEKKGLFGIYSKVGVVKNVNISGVGALNHQIVDNNYSTTGTNDVRVTWKQTTTGHTAAFLRY